MLTIQDPANHLLLGAGSSNKLSAVQLVFALAFSPCCRKGSILNKSLVGGRKQFQCLEVFQVLLFSQLFYSCMIPNNE